MADKPLPECRVKARNASANRENRIHGRAVAGAGIAGVCFLRPLLEGEGLEEEGVVAIVAEPATRPVAHVLHTAIHRLPALAR